MYSHDRNKRLLAGVQTGRDVQNIFLPNSALEKTNDWTRRFRPRPDLEYF